MSLNSRVFMELQVRVGRYLERRLGLVQPHCQVLELGGLCQGLSLSHERDQEAESKHPCCILTARGNVVRCSLAKLWGGSVGAGQSCGGLCPPGSVLTPQAVPGGPHVRGVKPETEAGPRAVLRLSLKRNSHCTVSILLFPGQSWSREERATHRSNLVLNVVSCLRPFSLILAKGKNRQYVSWVKQ